MGKRKWVSDLATNQRNIHLLDPTKISFTTVSIPFRDARTPKYTLMTSLRKITGVQSRIDDRDHILVIHDEEHNIFVTRDNRRLWALKQLRKDVHVELLAGGFNSLGLPQESVKIGWVDDDVGEFSARLAFLNQVHRKPIGEDIDKVQPIPLSFTNLEASYHCLKAHFVNDTIWYVINALQNGDSLLKSVHCNIHELETGNDHLLRKFDLSSFLLAGHQTRNLNSLKNKSWHLVILSEGPIHSKNKNNLLSNFSFFWTLGLLTSPGYYNNGNSLEYMTVTAFRLEGCKWMAGNRIERCHVVLLDNMSSRLRIWEGLNPPKELFKRGCSELRIVEDTICNTVGENAARREEIDHRSLKIHSSSQLDHLSPGRPEKLLEAMHRSVERFCLFRKLNRAQPKAVLSIALDLVFDRTPRVRLVQGPPGTGKTTTLVTFLSIVTCLDRRTLACAPSNRAVCVIANRFTQFFESNVPQCQQFHTAIATEIVTANCLRSGDTLLLGIDNKLDVNGKLSSYFLLHRLKRLEEAICRKSGWLHCCGYLLDLFKHPLTAYWKAEGKHKLIKGFLAFMWETLIHLCTQLILLGYFMRKDLPTKLLPIHLSKYVQAICDAAANLIEALPDFYNATDLECVEWYNDMSKEPSFLRLGITIGETEYSQAKDDLLELFMSPFLSDVFGRGVNPQSAMIEELCVKHACVIFCTLASAGRSIVQNSGSFESLVIDEAAQIVEAETSFVTRMGGLSQNAKTVRYDRSLFERLVEGGYPCDVLNVQYKMHPDISLFSNWEFYEGCISDSDLVKEEDYRPPYLQHFGPYKFIDVPWGEEEFSEEEGKSKQNRVEVDIVEHLFKQLQTYLREHNIHHIAIGIITPYRAQVKALQTRHTSNRSSFPNLQVDVNTVDGVQGGEWDVVVFSTVCANKQGHIGFLSDHRRVNVALTRGRYCVWIVGKSYTLAKYDPLWANLLEDASNCKCFVRAEQVSQHEKQSGGLQCRH